MKQQGSGKRATALLGALCAAAAFVAAGCSGAIEPMGAMGGSDKSSLSLQRVPANVEQIDLTVSGSGMDTIQQTLTPDTDAALLDIPPGSDRTFTAEGGGFTIQSTTDVPPSGTNVLLSFLNEFLLGETQFSLSGLVLSEYAPDGGNRPFELLMYGGSLKVELDEFGVPLLDGHGDYLGLRVFTGNADATLPAAGEYGVVADLTSAGEATATLGVDVTVEGVSYAGGEALPNTHQAADGGTAILGQDGREHSLFVDMSAQLEPFPVILGTFAGEPDMIIPAAPGTPTPVTQLDPATVDLTWQDSSNLETRYVVQRSIDGGVTFSTIGEVSAAEGGELSFLDEGLGEFNLSNISLVYRVLTCRGEVCAPSPPTDVVGFV